MLADANLATEALVTDFNPYNVYYKEDLSHFKTKQVKLIRQEADQLEAKIKEFRNNILRDDEGDDDDDNGDYIDDDED